MPPASRGWAAVFRQWHHGTSSRMVLGYATTATPLPTISLPRKKIQLRKYQEECIQAVLSSLGQGHKRLGVSLATGSGKTVIFTQLIDRVIPHTKSAYQTLILAHRQELVEQAARHCSSAYPSKTVEIEMGSLHASGSADITVASLQSIVSGDRIEKFDPSTFKLVLVDEAHHIVSPGYMKTLEYFGLSKARPDSPALVGVSATLSRFDGLRIGAAIDQIVYHKDYIDMIGEKWLSDVSFTTVQTKADISRVRKAANGDFQPSELSQAVNTDQINNITVRSWMAKARDRKSTLVFCVDLAHVAGLTNAFRAHGIEAQFVTGSTPKPERSARLDSFKRGEFPILVNCGVFTEGTDIPNIDCVLLARPTKSRNLLVQMIGRGMRLHPGKTNCHVIDMVAALETGIVCTPTLFGLDPQELLEDATVQDMEKIKLRKEEEAERRQLAEQSMRPKQANAPSVPQKVTFTDYETVFDLISDTSGERHVRAISQYAWVCVSEDRYVLTSADGIYLKIDRNSDDESSFLVTETVAIRRSSDMASKTPFMKPRKIARTPTFTDAVHAADTYAKKKYPLVIISKNQSWRNRPATEGQLAFLNKLRQQDEQLTANDVTKGKAGDMITKVKHGARGRFSGLEADKRRLGKVKLKLEQEKALKERERVSVGPLAN
ncbi:DEAD/DEAH box helicase-like protein [Bisporella sp. PMI_857]|nr:DEAD/DEAH box helicase-like protein [Bisporella sp. PMI_857]